MSFSLILNSVDGNVLNNRLNAVEYNFDFQKTPPHDGAYKVSVTFESEYVIFQNLNRATMFIYANLGCDTFYKTNSQYTSATPTQQIGICPAHLRRATMVSQQQFAEVISVTQIPANSNTNAHTKNTTITTPSTYDFMPIAKTTGCLYKDNQFFILKSKPTNNIVLVELKRNFDELFRSPLPRPYTLILTFEAI